MPLFKSGLHYFHAYPPIYTDDPNTMFTDDWGGSRAPQLAAAPLRAFALRVLGIFEQ